MFQQKIILASRSPRRKQLLEESRIDFEVVTSPTDEIIDKSLTMENAVVQIAKEKALAVKNKAIEWAQGRCIQDVSYPILAADTVVILDNKILGKPKSKSEATEILQSLSGRCHQVMTGVAILWNREEILFSDITEVEFHYLSDEQINYYVDTYQPYDKAGAYAIQEWIGMIGIKRINGDFYNVMGLPISRVIKALEGLGFNY